MSLESILNGLQLRRTRRRAKHGQAGRRPRFETFEDRCLLSLTPGLSYSVGTEPQAIVAADFNYDGRLDLATANTGDNTVSVLLGDEGGTFQAAKSSAAGANPFSLAVGDFNADGTLDLAAINRGASGLNVMFGNRDGTFQAPNHIEVGYPTAESLAAGDFNRDGKMDLVVTSNYRPADYYSYPQGRADVLLAIGDGSFAVPRTWAPGDRALGSAVVADMNGDGNLDLVTELADYSSIIVLRGDGLGNIGNHPEAGWAFADGTNPSAAGDLDGDGNMDIVSAPRWFDYPGTVGVMLGDGEGGISYYPDHHDIGGTTDSAILGDFDRDGSLDIAAAITNGNSVSILRNAGSGTFSAAELFAAGPGATAVAAGDFNGDGWLDVATANAGGNSLSVLLNNRSWGPVPPTVSVSDATVTEGNTGTTSATFTVSLSKVSNVDVTVHYDTVNGTAMAGSDYTAASGDVVIPAGQTSRTFTVAVLGDRLIEPTENFAVNLSAPTNASIGDGQAIGTILDNEPRISINNVSATEGNGKTPKLFTFTVSLAAAYDQPVTVNYATANGTATAGSDYQSKTGGVTFAPGETSKTITVAVIGDRLKESNETFFVNLSGAIGGEITDSQGLGTILNDDNGGSKGNGSSSALAVDAAIEDWMLSGRKKRVV